MWEQYGYTPLHYACSNGNLNIAQYLIREEHCNPSCENNDGYTPLHNACLRNHAHIVQYLLSTGRVNPLTKNKYGYTALYLLVTMISSNYFNHSKSAGQPSQCTRSLNWSSQETAELVRLP